jgi:hypothetical protein
MNRVNFGFEDLKVDYLSLNLQFNSLEQIEQIANLLAYLCAKIGNNILRIGKRSSSNFFRIYLKSNGRELRFKIELKNLWLKDFNITYSHINSRYLKSF